MTVSDVPSKGSPLFVASRIYSPSATEDWLKCPRFRQLRSEGNEARHNPWAMQRDMGTCMHAALASYYLSLKRGDSFEVATQVAFERGRHELQQAYVEQSRYTLPGLTKVLLRGLSTTIQQGIQVPPHTVVAVEEKFSHGILDLLTRVNDELVITDHKVIYDADERKANSRLEEYETSHQLYHQAWVVRQHFGETPKWKQIQQIVLTPTCRVRVEPFAVTDEQIDRWLESSQVHWQRMAQDEEAGYAPMNTTSCYRYGKCDFFEHCHDGGSLEALYKERGV